MISTEGVEGGLTGQVAVVVVNYGAAHLLESNLGALRDEAPRLRIVVVDNFSSEKERARVRTLADRLGLDLVESENNGFGTGMNIGVEHARGLGATRYLLLNPDARISASSAAELERRARESPLTMLAPVITRPDGRVWFDGAALRLTDGRMISTRSRRSPHETLQPWLSGAVLMVSAELWRRTGGFSDDFFLYWEDVDLSWRVTRAGGRLEIATCATAVHDEGGTQAAIRSNRAKSTTYYYYMIRNRLLFAAMHLDQATVLAWRRTAPRVAFEILLHGGRRQMLEHPLLVFGAAYRGVRDGRSLVAARGVSGGSRRLAGPPSPRAGSRG